MVPLADLWKHLLKAGRVGSYLKLLVTRHRRVLGYLILVAGLALSLAQIRHQSDHFNTLVIETGVQGRQASCQRDLVLTNNIRSILIVSQRATKLQHDKGIITDEQYTRSVGFLEDSLKRVPVPDCKKYVDEYREQIEDGKP